MISAFVFGLIGLAIAGLGGWLAALGGSPAYLAIGAAILLTAVLIARRSAAAFWVYGLTMVATLGWAVWEVGFDWWQLAPRGGIIVVLGIWLWALGLSGRLREPDGGRGRPLPIALSVLFCVAVAVYAMFQDPSAISGEVPAQVVAG